MAGEVVHDDDGGGWKFGYEDFFDVGLEGIAVDRPIKDPGCDDAARGQPGEECRRFPMAVRNADPQAFAALARPCLRAILVEAQVSSMKTSRSGSRLA